MLVKYDALLDDLRENDSSFEVVSTLPASGSFAGQAYIQQSDSTLYAWYADEWQAIFTFPITPPTTSGTPIGLLLVLTRET